MKNFHQPTTLRPERGMRWLARGAWCCACNWVRANTFGPLWLPPRLRHPAFGYLVAAALALIAAALTLLLIARLPNFSLFGVLTLVVVLVVALYWGSGPGLVATLASVVLLKVFAFPPQLSWSLVTATEAISLGLILVVGLLVSLVAGRVAQSRRQAHQARQEAEARAAELSTIFETLMVGVFVYDREGHLIAHNRAVRVHLGMDHMPESAFWTPEEWAARLDRRDAQGRPMLPEQSPPQRILRGEVLTGEAAVEESLRTLDGREFFALVTGAPIRNQQGEITGAVLVGQDITERHRLEQEVAARARQLEATIDTNLRSKIQ